jgi:hypothetical protein
MPKYIGELVDLFGAFRNYLFFRCLIGGLVISLTAIVIIGILVGTITIVNVFPFFDIDSEKFVSTLLASGFIILWLLIALSGYLAISQDLDDAYTWLRERLAGTWGFQLESWRLNSEHQWVREFMIYPVHIFIDPKTRKLRARVQQRQNEFFEDADFDTGILHIEENGADYRLYLILKIKQRLRGVYKNAAHIDSIDTTLLASLDIDINYDAHINNMKGIWYDVDNTLWRIISELNTDETMENLWETFDNGVNNFQGRVIADRSDLMPT